MKQECVFHGNNGKDGYTPFAVNELCIHGAMIPYCCEVAAECPCKTEDQEEKDKNFLFTANTTSILSGNAPPQPNETARIEIGRKMAARLLRQIRHKPTVSSDKGGQNV